MRNFRLFLLLSLLLLAAVPSCKPVRDNYTVVISLDGFRWDYPEYYNTTFLDSIELFLRLCFFGYCNRFYAAPQKTPSRDKCPFEGVFIFHLF